jgi:hypothetical protein
MNHLRRDAVPFDAEVRLVVEQIRPVAEGIVHVDDRHPLVTSDLPRGGVVGGRVCLPRCRIVRRPDERSRQQDDRQVAGAIISRRFERYSSSETRGRSGPATLGLIALSHPWTNSCATRRRRVARVRYSMRS